ncbi:MAG: ABC transporter ATP-binding protein [Leptospiraceae bacterium]|nr:ABC transporter ATP-binding protein [Leptospiraceae bacterium]
MITVDNLTKYYGDKLAISNLKFELKKGEIVGLLGLNGSGKTTTIRILTGFLIPTEGSVSIDGINNFSEPIEAKKKIGYLPETPPLYEDMDIESYLTYVAKIKGIDDSKIESELKRVMEKTSVTDVSQKLIAHLSLGYRKRVGIAQALLGNPPVIIMDEPISGLDPKQILEMRNMITGLKGEHTVLVSSHILSEVYKTCDRFLFIHEGKLLYNYSRVELDKELTKYSNLEISIKGKTKEDTIQFLKQIDPNVEIINIEEELLSLALHFTLKPSDQDSFRETLYSTVKQNGLVLQYFKNQDLTLEQIFLTTLR